MFGKRVSAAQVRIVAEIPTAQLVVKHGNSKYNLELALRSLLEQEGFDPGRISISVEEG